MMQNLQICGLGFLSISIMYYLMIDIFEKSKRLRQNTPSLQELPAQVVTTIVPPSVHEGVYPMYIDCSRLPRGSASHTNSALTPAAI
ncbi:hypothetical protein [Paenibacillus roseipurpureus]|uniref:Uncharacterized protein n=1 Tax=Paenibacillus roseopurpureus TaxID=2918901 RepID=A0AA96LUE3_9BACL|nr:hypothetical protein [Paenibacillus sp. MBLB1832]WNR46209.1 hypothetical protein MJB10_08990 [Paenibacillus sp. MBLB1832]